MFAASAVCEQAAPGYELWGRFVAVADFPFFFVAVEQDESGVAAVEGGHDGVARVPHPAGSRVRHDEV